MEVTSQGTRRRRGAKAVATSAASALPPSRSSAAAAAAAAAVSVALTLAHPGFASAETIETLYLAGGNSAFLEREYNDLKYAGVQDVVPGVAGGVDRKADPAATPVQAVKVGPGTLLLLAAS